MYENLYQFHSDPFRLAPDPRFCYEHERFRKGRAYMKYAVSQGDGILMITGHPGTGKTMLIEHFLYALDRSSLLTATLLNTQVEEDDLFRMVGFGFGINVRNLDRATILQDLQNFLVTKRRSGHRALLIVDEAQNLSASALEQLRMVTNLTDRSQPLLQLFLVGQKQLIDIVHTPAMEPLYQRLIAATHLEPLGLEESVAYIQHRLRCAGWRGDPHLTKDIRVLIHRFSGGYPRLINKICGRLLLYGSVSEKHRLDSDDFFSALEQVQDEYLMPGNEIYGVGTTPDIQEIMHDQSGNADWKQHLTREERDFLEKSEPAPSPEPVVTTISPPPDAAPAPRERTPAETVATAAEISSTSPARPEPQPDPVVAVTHAQQAARYTTPEVTAANSEYARPPRAPGSSQRRGYRWVGVAASVILLVSLFVIFGGDFGYHFEGRTVHNSEMIASADASQADTAAPAQPEAATVSNTAKPGTQQISDYHTGPRAEKTAKTAINYSSDEPAPEPVTVALVETGHSKSQFAPLTSEPLGFTSITDDSKRNKRTPEPKIKLTRTTRAVTNHDEPVPVPAPADPVDPDTADKAEPSAPAEATSPAVKQIPAQPVEPERAAVDHNSMQREAKREIERLLISAQNAIRKDYLTTPSSKSAYRYLRQVLRHDPDNQAAMQGMNKIVKRYNVLAGAALERRDYRLVQTLTRRGLRIEPDNKDLRIMQAKAQLLQDEALAQSQAITDPVIEEPYEPHPDAQPDENLFEKLRAFFEDLTPDEVSTNVFESEGLY